MKTVRKALIVRAAIPELNAGTLYVVAVDTAEQALAAVSAGSPLSWPLEVTDYEFSKKTLRRMALRPGEVRRL